MAIMKSSRVPEILLNSAAMMFVDEALLNRKGEPVLYDDGGAGDASADSENSRAKFVRSKSLKESFKVPFARSKTWSRSFTRSKSTESASEVRETWDKRRAVSSSPTNYTPKCARPVPTPLLVEDPPSSDNVSDLEELRNNTDPALLNGSSGNFGSAGARSAPSTPQGIIGTSTGVLTDPLSQPCTPGCITPSIQRSPSHNLFSKYDKGTLKQLSCSTPIMTAQAQSPEPPSPKSSSKDEKNTTSKARQKKFRRHFATVDDDEKVLNHYSCALIGDILLQGHLYITKNYFAFYSNVFGYVTKLLIPILSVKKITKEKTARIIPNAIGIATTTDDRHVFGSLISRDSAYRYLQEVWLQAKDLEAAAQPTILIKTPVPSDVSDSSETRDESGRESAASEINTRFRKCTVKPEIRKSLVDGIDSPKIVLNTKVVDGSQTSCMSKQRLLLFASTLLLILLFFSAAVLLYRIGKIQHRYSLALQDNFAVSESEDVYSELFQWQNHLHSKSAGAVHSFLDTNLDQIAKVRQSLEALSTLLMPNESNISRNGATKTAEIPNDS